MCRITVSSLEFLFVWWISISMCCVTENSLETLFVWSNRISTCSIYYSVESGISICTVK